jgi:hypothetical protein
MAGSFSLLRMIESKYELDPITEMEANDVATIEITAIDNKEFRVELMYKMGAHCSWKLVISGQSVVCTELSPLTHIDIGDRSLIIQPAEIYAPFTDSASLYSRPYATALDINGVVSTWLRTNQLPVKVSVLRTKPVLDSSNIIQSPLGDLAIGIS